MSAKLPIHCSSCSLCEVSELGFSRITTRVCTRLGNEVSGDDYCSWARAGEPGNAPYGDQVSIADCHAAYGRTDDY